MRASKPNPWILRALILTLPATFTSSALGALLPASTIVTADAQTYVATNPFQAAVHNFQQGTTGDIPASAHQASQFPAVTPTITSDVTSSVTSHIDASGLTGNAHLTTTWLTNNSLATADPNNTGVFGSVTQFKYTFNTTVVSYKVILDITTTSTLPTDPGGSFAANHDVGIGPNNAMVFENLASTGTYHFEYTLSTPNIYNILIEHAPNAALTPFPAGANGTRTVNTNLTFSITPVPEPTTLPIALLAATALLRRRARY